MNDFKIVILGYYIHLFDSIAFIGLQCPILNTPCNFQRFCINNYDCPNSQQGSRPFKACPHTLWDEPHPPWWNPNDAQRLNVPTKAI